MASLQKKGESWYCQFLYHGKRHTFTIGKVEPDEAESKANQVDYLLMRIRQGLLTVPPETDIVVFLQHDGKPPEPTLPTANESPSVAVTLTLGALRDRYLRTHENGSLEQTTIDGINTHFRHLVTTLAAWACRPLPTSFKYAWISGTRRSSMLALWHIRSSNGTVAVRLSSSRWSSPLASTVLE